jgi:hypothetical protein
MSKRSLKNVLTVLGRPRVAHVPSHGEHAQRSGVWRVEGEDRSRAREGWAVGHMGKKQAPT